MLRGFDPFMNLVIDDAIEYRKECFQLRPLAVKILPLGGVFETQKKDSSSHTMGMCVIRGNSVLMIEALERI